MKTTEVTTEITKSVGLNEYAELLLNNGFTIIAPAEPSTYFHFSIEDKIGYVQDNGFEGYTFSSVHKHCRECGTGFRVIEPSWDNLTLESAVKTALCMAPEWARSTDSAAVKKYKDVAEFVSNDFRKDNKVLTLNN